MTSVATSHTSTKSFSKSKKHAKHRVDGHRELIVKTAGLQLEPSMNTTHPGETLPVLLGDRTRRSRCTPEFLLELAARDTSEHFEEYGKKLKIITGTEAVEFYKQYQGGSSTAEILNVKEDATPNVVFAVAVDDAGRKRADYYTTWAEDKSARDATEAKELKHLHSQFRKTARVLDKEFKRASIYGLAPPVILPEKNVEEPQDSPLKVRPPGIFTTSPEVKVDGKLPSPPVYEILAEATLHSTSDLSSKEMSPTPIEPYENQQTALTSITEVEPNYFPTLTPFSTPAPAEQLLTPEGIKKSNSSIRSSRSKGSNKSSAASSVSVESHRGKHGKVKDIPEFLIVLFEERIDKDTRTWHGLERQVSRSTTRSSSRISGWDGPLARSSSRSFIHPARPDGDESSESEEEWDNAPVIPTIPFFGMARSFSEPHHAAMPFPAPMLPPHFQRYSLAVSLNGSPIGSFANLGAYGPSPRPFPAPASYLHSPYAPPFVSRYQSPLAVPARSMSRASNQPSFRQS
ncbi:hypothetical protein C0991_006581 [Blastosporella zonata]|nr:hypothetical protein C0991_006581 [Blastosporella zonata]